MKNAAEIGQLRMAHATAPTNGNREPETLITRVTSTAHLFAAEAGVAAGGRRMNRIRRGGLPGNTER
jgi:hypothetical protein